MSAPEKTNNVESILNQMQLREPSSQMDDSIQRVLNGASTGFDQEFDESRTEVPWRRFGWAALASTVLAAGIGGFLIGSAVSTTGTNDFSRPVAQQQLPGPTEDARITPVRFNTQAYELMHGHSTNPEYANCDSCHVDGQDEAFEGWFYGDGQFFKTHKDAVKSMMCSSCHVNENKANRDRQKIRDAFKQQGLKHSDFPDTSCMACHRRIDEKDDITDFGHQHWHEPRRIKIPNDKDPFHHHFENVENCSNCHVGIPVDEQNNIHGQDDRPLNREGIQSFRHDKAGGACKDCHIVQSRPKQPVDHG